MNDDVKIVISRLRGLVESSPLSSAEISVRIGITKSTISRYLSEVRTPDLATAIKLARYFGVSLDWLCGLSDSRFSSDKEVQSLCEVYPTLSDDDKAIISLIVNKYKKEDSDAKGT